MCGINIKKIRFSMLINIDLDLRNYDALAIALDEHEFREKIKKNKKLREIYASFLVMNKYVVLLPPSNNYSPQNMELDLEKRLIRYFANRLKAECSNILFIYDFRKNDC